MVIKGILDPEDAKDAVRLVPMVSWCQTMVVVSSMAFYLLHVHSTNCRCSQGDMPKSLADLGIRNGLDVVRMLALRTRMLGQACLL